MAVEQLTSEKYAEKGLRQDAPQTIFSGRLDIFYPRNLSQFSEIRVFQQPRLISSVKAVVVHFMFMTVEENPEITQKKRFCYGLLLAWVPLIFFIVPTAIGILRAIAQVSSQKATGFAFVAGGVAEVAATFGLVAIVASEVVGMVMLVRTSSRNRPIRTVVAIVSVVCSGLLLSVLGLFLWFATVHHWQ